eukprot:525668-Rhodomonas_salina.2
MPCRISQPHASTHADALADNRRARRNVSTRRRMLGASNSTILTCRGSACSRGRRARLRRGLRSGRTRAQRCLPPRRAALPRPAQAGASGSGTQRQGAQGGGRGRRGMLWRRAAPCADHRGSNTQACSMGIREQCFGRSASRRLTSQLQAAGPVPSTATTDQGGDNSRLSSCGVLHHGGGTGRFGILYRHVLLQHLGSTPRTRYLGSCPQAWLQLTLA